MQRFAAFEKELADARSKAGSIAAEAAAAVKAEAERNVLPSRQVCPRSSLLLKSTSHRSSLRRSQKSVRLPKKP